MRFLTLGLFSIALLPMGLQAAGPKPAAKPKESSFWERKTCYTQGTLKVCTTIGLHVVEDYHGPGSGTSLLGLLTGPGLGSGFSILPSAIGILTKGNLGFQPNGFTSPGGCDGAGPARWTNPNSGHTAFPTLGGYKLALATGAVEEDHWAAVNECQTGDIFGWTWKGKLPKEILFVWRGESADGSVDFDCWADPKGGEECLSAGNFASSARFASTLSTVSTVPEPATIALLMTGMIAMALVVRRQRQSARSKGARDS